MENKIMYGVFKKEQHFFGYEGEITTRDIICICDTKEDSNNYAKKCNDGLTYNDDYEYIVDEINVGTPITTPEEQVEIGILIKRANELGMVTRLKTQEELDNKKV